MSKMKLDSVKAIDGEEGATVGATLCIRGTRAHHRRNEDHRVLCLDLGASDNRRKPACQELLAGETMIGPTTGSREGAIAAGNG